MPIAQLSIDGNVTEDVVHISKSVVAGFILCEKNTDEALYVLQDTPDVEQRVTCWRCWRLHHGKGLPAQPATPEHDKLREAKATGDATQLVGEFLDWLGHQGFTVARYEKVHIRTGAVRRTVEEAIDEQLAELNITRANDVPDELKEKVAEALDIDLFDIDDELKWYDALLPAREGTQSIIARFFDINQQALEDEKRALLDYIRLTNAATDEFKQRGNNDRRNSP